MNTVFTSDALSERDKLMPSVALGDMVWNMLDTLRRRWKLLGATVLVFTLISIFYVLTVTPTFTASGAILIDPRVGQAPERNVQLAPGLLTSDALTVDSELRVLISREVTAQAVRVLGLEQTTPEGPHLRQRIMTALGLEVERAAATPELGAEFQKERQFERLRRAFAENLKVQRAGESFVIDVSYSSTDIRRAAEAVNTLMQEYLRLSGQKNIDQVQRNRTWLSERISELEAQLRAAEIEMTQYRRDNDLLAREGALLPSEMAMNAAISELVRLQSVAISIEARSQLLQEQIASGSIDAVQIPTDERTSALADFESHLADLQQIEQSQLLIRMADSLEVRDVRRKQDQARALILGEFRQIQEQLVAKADALDRQKTKTENLVKEMREEYANDTVKMLELENMARDTASIRELHKRLLQEFNNSSQLLTYDAVPARVISWAAPPDVKSSPKSRQIVMMAVVAALVLGLAAIYAIEAFDQSFRSPSDVSEKLGLPFLGVIPTFRSDSSARWSTLYGYFKKLPRSARYFGFSVAPPGSHAAQTLSNVHISLTLEREDASNGPEDRNAGVVLGLTSSADDEGKTTTAFNLAMYLSEQNERVLLIDLDLTSPNLTRHIKSVLPETNMLHRFMNDAQDAQKNMVTIPEFAGLDIIGQPPSQAPVALRDIYALKKMLEYQRTQYNYIVVDLPPLHGAQNTPALADSCDSLLYLVHWGKVPQKLVQSALRKLSFMRNRTLGILFTRAALPKYRSYNRTEFADY